MRQGLYLAAACLLCCFSGCVGAIVGARAACYAITAYLDERIGVLLP